MIDTTIMNQQEVADKNNYPRTGKRGVPQQFPRKLFDMLDMESNRLKSGGCVSWSSCGRAFHIVDVTAFSKEILPTYFKTSKFSSFQRNLNLVSCFVCIAFILCRCQHHCVSNIKPNYSPRYTTVWFQQDQQRRILTSSIPSRRQASLDSTKKASEGSSIAITH
jgi:hypothetical protein